MTELINMLSHKVKKLTHVVRGVAEELGKPNIYSYKRVFIMHIFLICTGFFKLHEVTYI